MRLALIFGLFFPCWLQAQALTLQSGPQQVMLVELFTSEGCSSCPPADRWLSRLKNHPRLWKSIVPVAFHVDYWNNLGWTDVFAKPAYSLRQRRYRRLGHTNGVYTPGFVVNGKEWRGWFRRQSLPEHKGDGGRLQVEIEDNTMMIRYTTVNGMPAVWANVAFMAMDRRRQIKAGENSGKTLHHDFVVMSHLKQRLDPGPKNFRGQLNVAEARSRAGDAAAVAVWVTGDDQVPLQATGGYLQP